MAKTKIKKTIRSGRLAKVAIYTPRTRWDSPRARAQKSKATTAARKAMNIKDSRSKLEFLIAGNFEDGDLFVTLTYDDEHLPTRWAAPRIRRLGLRRQFGLAKVRLRGLVRPLLVLLLR